MDMPSLVTEKFANYFSKPLLYDFEIKMLLSSEGWRDFNLGGAPGI